MTGSTVFMLAMRSLWARKITAILTIISIAAAVLLFVAVENLRQGARTSFERTITETDVIVGARSSPINLILYSVFQLGDPTNNVTWETYEEVRARPDVAWAVPISLGDSHRGFRVVGTTPDYFEHYKYGQSENLAFADGVMFDDLFDVVIGAQVARELDYELGAKITLAHGLGATSFVNHEQTPFTVSGILKPTGTPVDRSVLVSLGALEAIHMGWQNGMPTPRSRLATPDQLRELELKPDSVTAMFVGATSRVKTLSIQRDLNTYKAEPLQAVIERRREMAILRAMGARAHHVLTLLVSEAALLAFIGSALGLTLLYGFLWLAKPVLEARFNISALRMWPGAFDIGVVLAVTAIAAILGAIPAIIALKRSLADGLTIRV